MGRSARKINNGVTSVYQSTESVVLDSVDTIDEHAAEFSRSVQGFGNDISQSFNNFVYDIKKGYAHPQRRQR